MKEGRTRQKEGKKEIHTENEKKSREEGRTTERKKERRVLLSSKVCMAPPKNAGRPPGTVFCLLGQWEVAWGTVVQCCRCLRLGEDTAQRVDVCRKVVWQTWVLQTAACSVHVKHL